MNTSRAARLGAAAALALAVIALAVGCTVLAAHAGPPTIVTTQPAAAGHVGAGIAEAAGIAVAAGFELPTWPPSRQAAPLPV